MNQHEIGPTQKEDDSKQEAVAQGFHARFQKNMKLLTSLLANPRYDVGKVMRLITAGIAGLAVHAHSLRPTSEGAYIARGLAHKSQVLIELRKGVIKHHLWRIQQPDWFNFDGPALRLYMSGLVAGFEVSMERAGIEESVRKNVMERYRQIRAAKEPELRRKIEAMDDKKQV